MRRRYSQTTVIFLLCTTVLSAQTSRAPGTMVQVQSSQRVTRVYVSVQIDNTSSKEMLIPVCGSLDEQEFLCSPLAASFEVRVHDKWLPAKANCDCPMGGLPLAKGKWLGAGESAHFTLSLPVNLFKLTKGQSVRLRLDVYPNEGAMNRMRGSSQLYSEPFPLP